MTGLDLTLFMPYALDLNGNRVSPEEAQLLPSEGYFCPECEQVLIYCEGAVQRPHFRHKGYHKNCPFKEDGADKVYARHALFKAIMDKADGLSDRPITLIRRCANCCAQHEAVLPDSIRMAKIKHFVTCGNSEESFRIADLALFDEDGGEPCLVEFFREREAPQYKFKDFPEKRWILVPAKATAQNPYKIEIAAEANFGHLTCSCSTVQARGPESIISTAKVVLKLQEESERKRKQSELEYEEFYERESRERFKRLIEEHEKEMELIRSEHQKNPKAKEPPQDTRESYKQGKLF